MTKIKEDAPTVNTGAIPNPAQTAMGKYPKYGPTPVQDRRRKKRPVLLKRFRKYLEDNGVI